MIVSLMQVRWLTCVMVRPAWRRASARAPPMLTPRLHCHIALRSAPGCGSSNRMRAARRISGPLTSVDIPPTHDAESRGPRSVLPAPQRINRAVQVIGPHQDVPGLGAFARARRCCGSRAGPSGGPPWRIPTRSLRCSMEVEPNWVRMTSSAACISSSRSSPMSASISRCLPSGPRRPPGRSAAPASCSG